MPVVRKTKAARRDLLDIWRYLDRTASTEIATALLLKIERVAEGLAEMPFSARARPELGDDIRSRPIESHVVFFRPTEEGIEIVRVLHGRRDVGADLME